jgi:hypothetical protein
MRLYGPAPAPVGTETTIDFDGMRVNATIVRVAGDDFAVEFAPSKELRHKLVRHVYGGRYSGGPGRINPSKVVGALFDRVFR